MAYEKVKRNRYFNPDPVQTANHASKNHFEDLHDFHIPLERMHNSNLHDWGIARGLEVSGTIGGTEIIVKPGVVIDSNGQLISLSSAGHADIGENPPEGESNEVSVPVHLSTASNAGKTVYVTIQFSEILRTNEGVLGRLEQVPWVRLQPVDIFDDTEDSKSIVLAIAVMDATGKLAELKTMDSTLPHRRQLIGETIEELRIQRSSKIGDQVQEKLSCKIGPGDAGGLKITVPDTQDTILFAREDGGDFKSLEIRANVGIGISSPSNNLEVNGTVKAGKFVGDGSGLIKAGQWTDVEGGISYNAGNVGIGTTNSSAKLEVNGDIKGNANLVINGNVGIGTSEPETALNVSKASADAVIRAQTVTSGNSLLSLMNDGNQEYQIVANREANHLEITSPGTIGAMMTFDPNNGNVGIGTTNSSAKLEVNGDIKANANLVINGNVGIGTDRPMGKLDVRGAIHAGNSDIYFTKVDHNHTGLGNTPGHAAIENAASHGSLLILGRAMPQGRIVRLWDYLQVNGGMDITGNVGIGTTNPQEKLDVFGTIRLHGKSAFQGFDSFLRINQDNEFSSGTHFAHRANFWRGITTGSWWDVEPGEGNLLVQGKVGIGISNPTARLEVEGDIKFRGGTRSIMVEDVVALNFLPNFPFHDKSSMIVTGNDWGFLSGLVCANKVCSQVKNFVIDHPLHPDTHDLIHSTLEGPEIAVFYRGEAQLSNGEVTVTLPDYFEALARKENRTVLLTPKFEGNSEVSMLAASEVKDGKFTVKMTDSKNPSQKFYWEVKAIRADVEALEVEREKIQ